jgi:hypothetical protein
MIENSLLGSSLLMNKISSSKTLDGGLLVLLQQIADSLECQRSSTQRIPAAVKYQQALGMSLYLSGDVNFLGTFTREVEEQHANLLNLRNRTQEDMQQHAYRLLSELPVLFKNQVKSISIRYYEKESGEEKQSVEPDCDYGVDFEFEFDHGKIYTRILIANSEVCLYVGCAKSYTAEHFITSKNSLGEKLISYGLKFKQLIVAVHDGYLPFDVDPLDLKNRNTYQKMQHNVFSGSNQGRDEETRIQLRNAYAEGKMPDLEEFALRINSRDVGVTSEISEQLYCAMACFFAQLFEEE